MSESSRGPAPAAPTPRRLPRLEDFPETGKNALGSFQQRAWARIVDELVMELPLYALTTYAVASEFGSRDAVPTDYQIPLWVLGAAFALALTYEIVTVALWGRTAGKWIMGLRVARYTDGKRPSWGQAALRALLPAAGNAIGLALIPIPGLGAIPVYASAFSNPLRRGWHDGAGGTIVVRTR